ncbi:pyridoxal phosphate-dependent aminotransferase [bacterium]|nr:pyridoxal phosphate-dependent aminotransferase [bacterium]
MKLSSRIRSVKPSATLSINNKANELKAQGYQVISMAVGEPDFPTPEHICRACIDALKAGKTKYAATNGILPLREVIAKKFQRENHLNYLPQQIVVNTGAKHSVYCVFQILLDPGDEVIIPAPYWVSYPEIVTLAGGVPVFVQTKEEDRFLMKPEQLEEAITDKTRALIINTPTNPTGQAYSEEEIRALGAVLRKHPDVAVVSDEIYEHLVYDGFKHVSFAAALPDLYDRVFTVNGYAKTYSMTGWRLGYVACPSLEASDAIKRLQDQSTSGMTTFAQYGGVVALRDDQDCVRRMLESFDERRKYIVSALNELPGVECPNPRGTFYVFPNISGWGLSSQEAAMRLLEDAYVATVPGSAFGGEGHLRLSFATSMDVIEEAVKRIAEWIPTIKNS